MGKCPAKTNPDRLQEQQCNTQKCHGDEVCIARQDLVVAVDASGSVKEEGFEHIRDLVANLTTRYQSLYYGKDRMKVGVLVFGQGQYMDAGYISAAEEIEPLTFNLASVTSSIQGMTWQRGLTNMMQALKLADKMLESGRPDAQSAVLVITDGKYTNAFTTAQRVQQLKDKNIQIFMAPISAYDSDNLEVLKKWASSPWEQNYLRIPGIESLNNNYDSYAQDLVARFCPEAFSPSAQRSQDDQRGYTLVRTGALPSETCGQHTELGRFATEDACYRQARSMQALAFSYMPGAGRLQGTCYAEGVEVTADMWQEYVQNATDVPCPGGEWEDSPYFDTFFMNPGVNVELG